MHPLPAQCRVVEVALAAEQKRLVRRVGILLPEHGRVVAAVGLDAPAPPHKLLIVQPEVLPQLLLLVAPHGARRHAFPVPRLQIPRQKYRRPCVGARHRVVPQGFEMVVAVGGGLDDHHRIRLIRHRLHDAQQQLVLVLGPEGVFGDMYIGQRVASAHAALSRRLAADRTPQARPAALLLLVLGGVLEHQLLGVGVLPHGLCAGRQAVVEQLVHFEQVGRGRVFVGHDQRLYVGARHRVLEH